MSAAAGQWLVFVISLLVLAPLFWLGLRQRRRALAATDHEVEVGTNFLSGVAFVFAFLASPLGIVFSHLSLRQIAQTGASGVRLSSAALFVAYGLTVVQLVLLLWGGLTGYF